MVRCGVAYAHLLAQTTGAQTQGHERGKERERNSGVARKYRATETGTDRETDRHMYSVSFFCFAQVRSCSHGPIAADRRRTERELCVTLIDRLKLKGSLHGPDIDRSQVGSERCYSHTKSADRNELLTECQDRCG